MLYKVEVNVSAARDLNFDMGFLEQVQCKKGIFQYLQIAHREEEIGRLKMHWEQKVRVQKDESGGKYQSSICVTSGETK